MRLNFFCNHVHKHLALCRDAKKNICSCSKVRGRISQGTNKPGGERARGRNGKVVKKPDTLLLITYITFTKFWKAMFNIIWHCACYTELTFIPLTLVHLHFYQSENATEMRNRSLLL